MTQHLYIHDLNYGFNTNEKERLLLQFVIAITDDERINALILCWFYFKKSINEQEEPNVIA